MVEQPQDRLVVDARQPTELDLGESAFRDPLVDRGLTDIQQDAGLRDADAEWGSRVHVVRLHMVCSPARICVDTTASVNGVFASKLAQRTHFLTDATVAVDARESGLGRSVYLLIEQMLVPP
jgi:hypothetical protein